MFDGGLEQAEMHRIAAGKIQDLAFSQVWLDLGMVYRHLQLIRDQHEKNIRPLHRLRNRNDFKTVGPRYIGVAIFLISDDDVEAGVAQVLRLGVTLAAVSNRSDQSVLNDAEIRVLFEI